MEPYEWGVIGCFIGIFFLFYLAVRRPKSQYEKNKGYSISITIKKKR